MTRKAHAAAFKRMGTKELQMRLKFNRQQQFSATVRNDRVLGAILVKEQSDLETALSSRA